VRVPRKKRSRCGKTEGEIELLGVKKTTNPAKKTKGRLKKTKANKRKRIPGNKTFGKSTKGIRGLHPPKSKKKKKKKTPKLWGLRATWGGSKKGKKIPEKKWDYSLKYTIGN